MSASLKYAIARFWTLKSMWSSDSLKDLRYLREWQWLDDERIASLQRERVKALLLHASQHVPYYRRIFAEVGVMPRAGEIDVDGFSQIPLLSREDLRDHFEELKSDDLDTRAWFPDSSGGSTGLPVRFIQDGSYADWGSAVRTLFDEWSGRPIGASQVMLWGSERDLFVGRETIRTILHLWLRNVVPLNAFRMTRDRMRLYVNRINNVKPVQILAYADSMQELSTFVKQERLRVHQPESIMTSAGTLLPETRALIETTFGTRVFNRYGSREVGDIACECEQHQGLHVSVPTHLVEILRPDGAPGRAGETGEIVVTCLTNLAMPMIRYRIGDIGSWSAERCACGCEWPMLREVAGRLTDVLVRRDGSVILPEYFIHLIGVVLNSGWIKKFQVIQEDYDFLRILVVPTELSANSAMRYSEEVASITEKVRLALGSDCRIEFEFVREIAPTASGKFSYVTSRVRREQVTS